MYASIRRALREGRQGFVVCPLVDESDRLKLVTIGTTEEGRPQLMGIVTSPANHKKLARYQTIARWMARSRGQCL